jgi:hypothetical protein
MDYVPGGTTCQSKAEFAKVLRDWFASDHETIIGEPSTFGGKALIRLDLNGQLFHLNGDTRDEGVEAYLRLVKEHGENLIWHVIANNRGTVNAVAFGEPPQKIKYFYLYADQESGSPYTI